MELSFRKKMLILALAITLGATFLILKGNWPLDKVGETYSGINIPNDESERVKSPNLPPADVEFVVYDTPRAVPDFSFFTADGQEFSVSNWKGQKLLVNLWATWCAPCVEELPNLDRLKLKLESRAAQMDVAAISLDRQKDFDDIRRFLKKHNVRFLVPYMDVNQTVMSQLDISSFPVTLILNEKGQEISRYEGPLDWDDPKVVDALLKL